MPFRVVATFRVAPVSYGSVSWKGRFVQCFVSRHFVLVPFRVTVDVPMPMMIQRLAFSSWGENGGGRGVAKGGRTSKYLCTLFLFLSHSFNFCGLLWRRFPENESRNVTRTYLYWSFELYCSLYVWCRTYTPYALTPYVRTTVLGEFLYFYC